MIALFKHDLKALLAFSTVSHLGLITMLLGTGTAFGAKAAVFHILNHATFKAALFMSAGIIDHETHTRDIQAGWAGCATFDACDLHVIATLAALSMAGIPLLNGFLVQRNDARGGDPYRPVQHTMAGASVGDGSDRSFSAAYCFRLIGHTFLGPKRDDYPSAPA